MLKLRIRADVEDNFCVGGARLVILSVAAGTSTLFPWQCNLQDVYLHIHGNRGRACVYALIGLFLRLHLEYDFRLG